MAFLNRKWASAKKDLKETNKRYTRSRKTLKVNNYKCRSMGVVFGFSILFPNLTRVAFRACLFLSSKNPTEKADNIYLLTE